MAIIKRLICALLSCWLVSGQMAPIGGGPSYRAIVVVTLTSGTSWTAPSGVTSAQVECWGAGGGGGQGLGFPGGGGGAYARRNSMPLTPGNMYTYAIGQGGAGASSGVNGSPGTRSIFTGDSGITCTASPGGGGTSTGVGTGGTTAGSSGDAVFSGGDGAAGNYPGMDYSGGGGGSGGSVSNGNPGSTYNGGAAVTGGGPGGAGSGLCGGSGQCSGSSPIFGPGGGGGGGFSNVGPGPAPGGDGYNGQIVITY